MFSSGYTYLIHSMFLYVVVSTTGWGYIVLSEWLTVVVADVTNHTRSLIVLHCPSLELFNVLLNALTFCDELYG